MHSREIEQADDIERLVRLVHAIYHAELHHFVSARLTTAAALKRLEQSLLLFLRGGAHSQRPRPKRKPA